MKTPKLDIPDPSAIEQEYYKIAVAELGQSEIAGDKHNSRILEYFNATSLKATEDEVPWCSAFVNFCLREAGLPYTDKAHARSFLQWGHKVKKPNRGSTVCVFWRGSKDGWVM